MGRECWRGLTQRLGFLWLIALCANGSAGCQLWNECEAKALSAAPELQFEGARSILLAPDVIIVETKTAQGLVRETYHWKGKL